MIKHFRRRHGFKGTEPNTKDFYTRLDPWEANLGLDEDVMISIFGQPKKNDVLIGDYVTVNIDPPQPDTNMEFDNEDDDEANDNSKTHSEDDSRGSEKDDGNDKDGSREIETHIIKIEAKDYSDQGENDLEPTDFVSVKIEPMDDEED